MELSDDFMRHAWRFHTTEQIKALPQDRSDRAADVMAGRARILSIRAADELKASIPVGEGE